MSGQLFKPAELQAPDPEGHDCEWCEKPATVALALAKLMPEGKGATVDTGLRVYACSDHAHHAREMTAAPMGKTGGVLKRKEAA